MISMDKVLTPVCLLPTKSSHNLNFFVKCADSEKSVVSGSCRRGGRFGQPESFAWKQKSDRKIFSRFSRGAVTSHSVTVVTCGIAVQAPITFHIGETSLSLPFSVEAATSLDDSISSLLSTFKEKEKADRPKRWQNMEYRLNGDIEKGEVFVEAFCNPNAYSNAFQAKILITVKDDKIRFTSEGALSAIKADLDQYLTAHKE